MFAFRLKAAAVFYSSLLLHSGCATAKVLLQWRGEHALVRQCSCSAGSDAQLFNESVPSNLSSGS